MSDDTIPANREEWLRRELKTEMSSFDTNSTRNRVYAWRYMFCGVACSAITTILLGLQGVSDIEMPYLRNVALVFSAGVTIASALDAFYNHRQLWIRYTVTWAQLRRIQKDFSYLLAANPPDKDQQIDELYKRFISALDEADASWTEIRNSHATKVA